MALLRGLRNDHSPLALVDFSMRCMDCLVDMGRKRRDARVLRASPPKRFDFFANKSVCFTFRSTHTFLQNSLITLRCKTYLTLLIRESHLAKWYGNSWVFAASEITIVVTDGIVNGGNLKLFNFVQCGGRFFAGPTDLNKTKAALSGP